MYKNCNCFCICNLILQSLFTVGVKSLFKYIYPLFVGNASALCVKNFLRIKVVKQLDQKICTFFLSNSYTLIDKTALSFKI